MDSNLIQEIIDNLNKLKDVEYKKANYKPNKKILYIKKKNSKKETIDLKIFKSKVNNTVYKYSNKNGEIRNIDFGNDLHKNKNIYNIFDQKEEKKKWRQLSVDEKCKIVNLYFERTNLNHNSITGKNLYSEKIINNFIELVKNNKILYKKQILYDEINSNILSIPCLIFDNDTQEYIYKEKEKKKKKRSAKEMFK